MNALLTNPFKERLRKGEVQIGLWLSSTTSYMAEIAATSGYDWLLIDGGARAKHHSGSLSPATGGSALCQPTRDPSGGRQ
ncbi:putative carbon-carbon lyase [Escherichia coli]|uniref:Putative carbon-carbon lyase n=1 Tax=Escherichia coli TaxID=562 RepID=A0A376FX45_ECOLX|nr:putative carbon-carbon lyase [Escherichia coli]